ncbi:hypothetical protein [Maribacter sp. 1_2014MBL_MicDiv]|uniref:hypothetical protein n=1 Tax=Maribacter sp. 1_2014MBL_MicDiv TaxID=1644130 RepID=UPI0008F496B3|nr:hypothetical protein [Maribacter sp. 1_2014MBL_MicDiv]APA65085.1 hypothetical protein YQ22_12595 [Maribacter sp. 1_2014MBL_MicDiv]
MSQNKKEISYTLLKAGIASIPILGGAASEILPLLLKSPIEKRKEFWMKEVGEKLKILEKSNTISLTELSKNDIFIDTIIRISTEALKTSEQEKLIYFKNALINTAILENLDISEVNIFTRFITEFTIWHIQILNLFDNPTNWFSRNEVNFPKFSSAPLSKVLVIAFSELKDRNEFYNLIWSDLYRSMLINTAELNVGITSNGLKSSRTTAFGKKFLSFIQQVEIQ